MRFLYFGVYIGLYPEHTCPEHENFFFDSILSRPSFFLQLWQRARAGECRGEHPLGRSNGAQAAPA